MNWLDNFNGRYINFLDFLHGVGDVLMTLTQTVFVSLGVPAILVLLLVVEVQRVTHGIQIFEVDKALAQFAAWALVLANLTLEFQVHHIEQQEGYHEVRKSKFSMRVWWRDFAYFIGWGDEWEDRYHSPAMRYKRLLGLVTFTILALALAGSMQEAMEQSSAAWHRAIVDIAVNSQLSQASVWAGGLLFAAAAVLTAQGLSRYVAIRTAEVLATMQRVTEQPPSIAPESPKTKPIVTEQTAPEPELFTAQCPSCGTVLGTEYDSEVNAKRAIAAHRRSCSSLHPELYTHTNGKVTE